ncbi:S-norcoclaurine synthase [Thalictrum thalictroides]|uniref:S-norcoclaurine synthase n=1 Tax=Thalictrum thalictroides TaxID=46969 RepID=A0A7J6W9J9_THATH|nr:S-norcoclaurine synthase [Thalictrum thalictroides]
MVEHIEHELEVNVPAAQVWKIYGSLELADLICKLLPDFFENVEVIEGDGGVGTVLKLVYAKGIPMVTYQKEKFTVVDHEKRLIVAEVFEGGLLDHGFSLYRFIFQIIEKDANSSIIKSSIEYEVKPGYEANEAFPSAKGLEIKYLEGKQNSSGCGDIGNRGSVSIDMAVRDIHTKGSILERLALLENRLFQLCLEIEASSTSSSSVAHLSENTSYRQGSSMTTEQSNSVESIDEQNHSSDDNHHSFFHRALFNRFEFLGNSMNNSTEQKHLISTKDSEDIPKNGKKFKARNRRWKTILGC